MTKLEVQPHEWEIVHSILQQHAAHYEVWAFGSRAKFTAKPHSDLDLAIISKQPVPLEITALLADEFSKSDLPWKVDIVDWACTEKSFQQEIEKNKVILQRSI